MRKHTYLVGRRWSRGKYQGRGERSIYPELGKQNNREIQKRVGTLVHTHARFLTHTHTPIEEATYTHTRREEKPTCRGGVHTWDGAQGSERRHDRGDPHAA